MFFGVASFLLLFSLFPTQAAPDSIQTHYQKAEALRKAGDLNGAEAEFNAILGEAYYKLGRIRLAEQKYSDSLAALESAASYRPADNEVLIDLGIAYFHLEKYEQALAPLKTVVAREPRNASAHHMLGKTFFMVGDFERATVELRTALIINPNDYDVTYTLGLAYLKRRQIAEARELYSGMIDRLGNRPQLRVLIGRAYRETGFLAESIEEFNKAVALDPKFPRVHFYLGLTYLLKDGAERLGEAQKEFRIELAAHPEEFFANYYLGIVATVERNWPVAIEFLEQAARIQPRNPDPYFFLGQSFQGLEKHEKAIAAFKQSIALNPDFKHNDYQVTNAHYRLGQSLIKSGKAEEGARELATAGDLKAAAFKRDEAKVQAFTANENKLSELIVPEGVIGDTPSRDAATIAVLQKDAGFLSKVIATAHNNVGLLKAEQTDYRNAAEQFRVAYKWDPNLQGLNFNWGLACYKAELYEESLAPLANELQAHPDDVGIKQLLGLSYFMTDHYAEASNLLTQVVAAKPNEAALYYPLALSLINEKKTDVANQVIQQMITHGQSSPQLHILLGRASYDQGDSVKALEELQLALTLDSKVLLAHFYAGVVYLKLGKFDEAKKEFEAELALNPNDSQAKYDLGFVLLAAQETERGISLMREVIAVKPQLADAHYELGKALLQSGDVKGAIQSLETAVKLEPDKAHIHYQLGRAYLAAGRKTDGDGHIQISKQLKEKERVQTNP
jgi:tetratricopeptide (TPR) repeat protein